MDPGLTHFWKNYEDVINWGYRISGAQVIQRSEFSGSTALKNTLTQEINTHANYNDENNKYDEDIYSSDSSIDIDLEYLNFSKKTLEHQAKIQKEKKNVDKEYGLCNSSSSENESTEIFYTAEEIHPKEFYGSKFNDIQCLENKLQSEFDTFCFMKKPVLWPGMALNLSVSGNLVIYISL